VADQVKNVEVTESEADVLLHLASVFQVSPVPVAALSKAQVCGPSPAEIVGSNPAEGMDVCLV
jgi:hypothetical protein